MNVRERIAATYRRQRERDKKRVEKRAKSYMRLSLMAEKKLSREGKP